ncbi:MAG: hypothetical protein BGO92_03320 [Magnetospirillum sp. 64-120]|nr:MAG: hypothetical protein BGO92_03320 [Magnetospirillum sp. 64-120]
MAKPDLINLEKAPDLRQFGVKDFRFRAQNIMADIKRGDWLVFKYYSSIAGAIVSNDDLDFLYSVGAAKDIHDLVDAFEGWSRSSPGVHIVQYLDAAENDLFFLSELEKASDIKSLLRVLENWERCGPDAPVVLALKGMVAETRRGSPALADFPECVPSNGPDGGVRAVEFGGGEHVTTGQLAIMGTSEGRQYLHGFIERAATGARIVLELPNGQIIDSFEEDGSLLYIRRTLLNSPISLLDVRVRRIADTDTQKLLG